MIDNMGEVNIDSAEVESTEQAWLNLQAESDRRLALLEEAQYFLEFVPIGMNDEDIKRFHQYMDELAKELADEQS